MSRRLAKGKHLWEDDSIQFMRLLAELDRFGLTNAQYVWLEEEMDLSISDIDEIFERSSIAWTKHLDNLRKK